MNYVSAALERWSPSRVFVAFNGGKDSTVVLDLYLRALVARGLTTAPRQVVWFKTTGDEFAEVENFVAHTVRAHALSLTVCEGSYQKCLAQFLREKGSKREQPLLLLIGLRASDQSSKPEDLNHFMQVSPTLCHPDAPGVRCNPILDWSYGDVWDYIARTQLDVCELYFRGYSSLGAKSKTVVNPHLFSGALHPRDLVDWRSERLSRQTSKTPCLESRPLNDAEASEIKRPLGHEGEVQ